MYYDPSLNLYKNFLLLSTDPFFFLILGAAVFCVAISKSGFGGGLGGLGFPIMVLVLPPKFALAVFLLSKRRTCSSVCSSWGLCYFGMNSVHLL